MLKRFLLLLSLVLGLSGAAFGQTGQWVQTSPSGCKAFTWRDGSIEIEWDGKCKDSLADGVGTVKLYLNNQIVYEGVANFLEGKLSGQGSINFATGDKYVGEWSDAMLHGQGTYKYANGDKYVGNWKEAKMSGQGTLTYANSDKYVGEWKDNKRHGQGIFFKADGRIGLGEWINDRANGQFIEYRADKTIERTGIYKDANLITSQYIDPNSFTRIPRNSITMEGISIQREEDKKLDPSDFENGMVAYRNRDYVTALEKLKIAAARGDARAQFQLGYIYQWERGVKLNTAESVRWYKLSAGQGNTDAQFQLGIQYNGASCWECDDPMQFSDDVEAARWFKMAADKGDKRAQYQLGVSYSKPELCIQDKRFCDLTEAARWFKLVAEKGTSDEQYKLGLQFDKGERVPKDHSEATRWFELAAGRGNVDAKKILGDRYVSGRGVAKNYPEAMRWYKSAAEQGDYKAMMAISYIYDEGKVVKQDYARAHMWSNLAEERSKVQCTRCGDDAHDFKYGLAKAMTPQQIVEAEKMARECKRRDFKNCD